MPIHYKSRPAAQTVVSFLGDVSVQTFGPEEDLSTDQGFAWLLLQDGATQRPGSPDPQLLGAQEGVLIGARDPEDLDSIIGGLIRIRQQLVRRPPSPSLPRGTNLAGDVVSCPPFRAGHPKVFPLQLSSEESYFSPNKGYTTKVVIWPRGFGTPKLDGSVVSIDGKTWLVVSVDTEEPSAREPESPFSWLHGQCPPL